MKLVWLFLLSLYCGFIFYLSHQPSLPVPMLFQHQDKLFHAGAYGVLAFIAINYFKHQIENAKKAFIISFIFCALYGMSDEWHQSFIEGRQTDVLDWLADCLGAFIALVLYKKLKPSLR